MKKTIAIAMGIFALVLVAVPVMACDRFWCQEQEPEIPQIENHNTVSVTQVVSSKANTGGNKLRVSGGLTGWGCWTQRTPAVGSIVTGDASATSLGQVGVKVQQPCATCGVMGDVTNMNYVGVTNVVGSTSNTGMNRLRVSGGTGRIRTGAAYSWSDGLTVVNVQVSPEFSN